MSKHLFPYEWRLADGYPAQGIENHRSTIFGTFVCGGGSTMGYKLAGFHHLGGVEIDPNVAEVYAHNNHPENLFIQDLREFNKRQDLPAELYQLDMLDGSPPCSTFSMAGAREKAWGKEKRFAEGQALQTLDDLVFVYCDTIEKLQPKTFLLENVKGLITGNARSYVVRILKKLKSAGYDAQVFCLNAAVMGVPQARERTFIIGHKSEYDLPKLVLNFTEPPIPFKDIADHSDKSCNLSPLFTEYWQNAKPGDSVGSFCALHKNNPERPAYTCTTSRNCSPFYPRKVNDLETKRMSTFPLDYVVPNKMDIAWLCGMSVPPVMTAQIAYQVYLQWIKKLK